MKKFLAFALITLMILSLFTACSNSENGNTVKISIDEWIGWQSLLDANGGLKTAPGSENAKRGLSVEYVVMNDATASSNALISGELAGAGYTINRYAFLQDKFDNAGVEVVMPFITNFSNGGDGIIASADIKTVKDLVGKKTAVPRYSEAQTLVEWAINNDTSLSDADKKSIRDGIVYFETADDTAKAFFGGQVDAAGTWEPYLTQASSSTDAHVLLDTSMNTNLILDGIVFRKDFVEANEEFVKNLIDAALSCSNMYKNEFKNIRQLPMFELMSEDEIRETAEGADLTSYSQLVDLLNGGAVSMYKDMAIVWQGIGENAYPDKASSAFTDKYVKMLEGKYEK